MTLKPGDLGIDSAQAIPGAKAAAAGSRFQLRYSAGVGNHEQSTQWKLCGPNEIAGIIASGQDFIANSEWYETRVTEGAAAGWADGAADLAFWKSRKLAQGATIYVSYDGAPNPAKYNGVESYLRAYRSALQGYYAPRGLGLYGGTPVLREMLKRGAVAFTWRTNAGSWSGDGLPYQPKPPVQQLQAALHATPANIWQTGSYWFNKTADENMVLRVPVGSHLEALAPFVHNLLGEIMALDRNSADYKTLVADIAAAVGATIPLQTFNQDRNGDRHGLGTWLAGVPGYVAPGVTPPPPPASTKK